MKKDFGKKGFAAKQSTRTWGKKWLWITSVFLMAILVCGAGFFAFQNKTISMVSPMISSFYVRVNDWIAERKTRLHQNLVKVKQIAANKKDSNQEIHFEFYTALPNMTVTVPDENRPVTDTSSISVVKNHAPVVGDSIANLAANDAVSSPKGVSAKKAANAQAIFDAEQLQRALKDEFNQTSTETSPHSNVMANQAVLRFNKNQYIVQMGVFKSAAGAERYRESFTSSGFAAKVVKIAMAGKDAYSVQIGPFISKDQAMLAQRQLQKKSANGIVRKL